MAKLAFTSTLAAALLAFSGAAGAQDKVVQECMDCHGKDGLSTESDVPVIAGFSAYSLDDAMEAYKDGRRPAVESKYRSGDTSRPPTDMVAIAKKLSEDEIKAASKFFASKKFVPRKQPFDAAKAAQGEKIHNRLCKKCHSDGGNSADDDAAILAGQWIPYLEHSFKAFRSGERDMDKKMKPKMEELGDADVDALIHYYASQQ